MMCRSSIAGSADRGSPSSRFLTVIHRVIQLSLIHILAVSHADAEKLMAEHETAVAALENALVQYERDHATTDNPDAVSYTHLEVPRAGSGAALFEGV